MKSVVCAHCQIEFGLADKLYDRYRQTGEGFLCPAGHISVFRPSENDQLRERLKQVQEANTRLHNELASKNSHLAWYSSAYKDQAAELKGLRRQIGILKGKLTRIKKKAAEEQPQGVEA